MLHEQLSVKHKKPTQFNCIKCKVNVYNILNIITFKPASNGIELYSLFRQKFIADSVLFNIINNGKDKVMSDQPVKLLDRVRQKIRLKGYSIRTEKAYVAWIRRFILFHNKRHPKEMGKNEIESFLSHLVLHRNVAPSTQNQAFNAILFLFDHVLNNI